MFLNTLYISDDINFLNTLYNLPLNMFSTEIFIARKCQISPWLMPLISYN